MSRRIAATSRNARALSGPLLSAFLFVGLCVSAVATVLARDEPGHVHAPAPVSIAAGPAILVVAGEVATPLRLDAAALARLPRTTVTASAHGVEGVWEGVPLVEVLRAAGAPLGEALRGRNLALYLRLSAADGYRVVFALAELDPKFRDDGVIVADHRNGKPLSAEEGPFRIVAPKEQRPGRWIRQLIRIDLLRAPD